MAGRVVMEATLATRAVRRVVRLSRVTVAIRVIPCLDVDAGRVVKGVNFENLRDAGDPVELAHALRRRRAPTSSTFLDVTASSGDRATTYDVVTPHRRGRSSSRSRSAAACARSTTSTGCCAPAPTRSASTPRRSPGPELIAEIADRFGSQVLVLSVDVRRRRPDAGTPTDGFEVTTHGGRRGTGIDAIEWCARAAELGAGEILLNSMDADGTKDGFDLAADPARPRARCTVPLIASGGAGAVEHFAPAVAAGADAVLAASVFHFGELDDRPGQGRAAGAGYPVR